VPFFLAGPSRDILLSTFFLFSPLFPSFVLLAGREVFSRGAAAKFFFSPSSSLSSPRKFLSSTIPNHPLFSLAGRVFKEANSKGAAAKASGNLVGLEREWAIGRKLNLLDDDDGFLEGFMQTGSKVLDKDGSFLGMILEKLNGKDVIKRLDDTKFNDVDYILAMVMQVSVRVRAC
jgi:hypothetical protein